MLQHNHSELIGATYIVFADEKRRYTYATQSACKLLGYTREELLAKSDDDVSYKVADVPTILRNI